VYSTSSKSGASVTPAKAILPNGNIPHDVDEKADIKVDEIDAESKSTSTTGTEGVTADVKAKTEEVKDILSEKAEQTTNNIEKLEEKVVGRKGKPDVKPEYKPNGFAHTPYWPFVCPPLSSYLLLHTDLSV
jgi:DNA polymerase II small subunit/DNA polymerase delta subunit B